MEVISRYILSFSYFRVAWQAGIRFPFTLTKQLPAENPCSFSLQMEASILSLSQYCQSALHMADFYAEGYLKDENSNKFFVEGEVQDDRVWIENSNKSETYEVYIDEY